MELVRASLDNYWDKFVTESPQGSIFSTKAFLDGSGYKVASYYLKKGNHILAAFCGIEKDGDLVIAPHVVHGGIMFCHQKQKNASQMNSLRFEITTFIVNELVKIYKNVAFNTHPSSFEDIRPFQWFNYGTDKPKFKINVRFTSSIIACIFTTQKESAFAPMKFNPKGACVRISGEEFLYNECSNTRKQAIREEGITVERDYLPLTLIAKYKETLGEECGDTETMRDIMESLEETGKLRMFVAKKNGEIGSVTAFGIHNSTAYNLFGAGTYDACGTHVIWEGMKELAKEGITTVDLEGINSPKRGAFKVSFGGSIIPYYQVSLCR